MYVRMVMNYRIAFIGTVDVNTTPVCTDGVRWNFSNFSYRTLLGL
jgi:hypothetical protein